MKTSLYLLFYLTIIVICQTKFDSQDQDIDESLILQECQQQLSQLYQTFAKLLSHPNNIVNLYKTLYTQLYQINQICSLRKTNQWLNHPSFKISPAGLHNQLCLDFLDIFTYVIENVYDRDLNFLDNHNDIYVAMQDIFIYCEADQEDFYDVLLEMNEINKGIEADLILYDDENIQYYEDNTDYILEEKPNKDGSLTLDIDDEKMDVNHSSCQFAQDSDVENIDFLASVLDSNDYLANDM